MGSFVYGLIIDSSLVYLNYIQFPSASELLTPSPLWMGSFWFAFSALLSGPMRWFIQFPFLAILGGMIGGPFSYWGGVQLHGLIFPQNWQSSMIALSLVWGVSMGIYIWTIRSLELES